MARDDMMFAAIDAALGMQIAGYKVTPKDAYDAIEYEKQMEEEVQDEIP